MLVARQAATLGSALTSTDIGRLRDELADGKRPRIQLRHPSPVGPAGTSGAVVLLQEPAKGEFIVVAVSGDELPFAPEELTWPVRRPRGSAAAKAAPKTAPTSAAKTPAGPATGSAPTPSRSSAPTRSLTSVPPAAVTPPPVASLTASPPPAEAAQVAPTPPVSLAPQAAPVAAARPAKTALISQPEPKLPADPPSPAPARRPRSGSKVPAFSVTLRFNGTTWSMESHRGGKRSKATPASLAAVRAFAERIDDVELRNQMRASLDLCRREVAARASALREELEQAEIFLAELEDDV
jgi:hypothetical protein